MARKSSPTQAATKADAGSPIFNGPYDPPASHYATSSDGQLNYNDPLPGHRVFSPHTPLVLTGLQTRVAKKAPR